MYGRDALGCRGGQCPPAGVDIMIKVDLNNQQPSGEGLTPWSLRIAPTNQNQMLILEIALMHYFVGAGSTRPVPGFYAKRLL
jgi:hypothetical protein